MNRRGAVIGVLIIACGLAAYADEAATISLTADPEPARFDTEIARFEAWDRMNSCPQNAVLFVGSSSIRLWPTAESFAGLPVINRGFGGSHISDVNHFAERIVLKYEPGTVVFYAGDNDIAAGKSPRQVIDDSQAFIELIHRRLPDTLIVYLPIKPSLARWDKWPRMSEANTAVAKLAASDERLEYLDTATVLLGDDGRPRPELFLDDGLHLNARGYSLWNEVLRPTLERPSGVDSSLP